MSSRKHFHRSDAYEIGEGNAQCKWIPIAAAVIGGAMSMMAARQQAKAQERAIERTNELQQQNMQPQMWGPAEPYARGLLSDAQNLYRQGAFMPGVNPLQLLGRANALGYAEGLLPQHIGAAQASWRRGLDPGLDPYVSGMIRMAHRGMLEDYSRNILPQIADRAQSVGGYGGSRQGVAQGIATEGLLKGMGDVSTRLLSDAYGKSLAQQRAAWGAAPNMLGLGFMPSQTQMDIGAQYRTDPMAAAQNLQGYAALINPYTTLMGGTGGVAAPYQAGPSPWTAAMQGAGSGWSFGNLLNQQWGQGSQVGTPSQVGPNTAQQIGQTMQLGSAGPGTGGGGWLAQGVTGQPGSFL